MYCIVVCESRPLSLYQYLHLHAAPSCSSQGVRNLAELFMLDWVLKSFKGSCVLKN